MEMYRATDLQRRISNVYQYIKNSNNPHYYKKMPILSIFNLNHCSIFRSKTYSVSDDKSDRNE